MGGDVPQVAPFFVVTWPPNLISSDPFKRISGPDSDEKLVPNIGSCAYCVVPEGALYGKIEASKIPPLPIESYYHVPIHPFFSAC
jgi:hypothetical protein